jgi:hypothetical protein
VGSWSEASARGFNLLGVHGVLYGGSCLRLGFWSFCSHWSEQEGTLEVLRVGGGGLVEGRVRVLMSMVYQTII